MNLNRDKINCFRAETDLDRPRTHGAMSYSLNKAPGPDGFPLAFWSFSWDFVKVEVLGFFREFFEHNQFVKSLNATFLVLVPKGRTVEDLKDLRPISLVGSLYKI